MAASIVWLDQAKDDVRALIDYLSPRNPTATLAYIDDLEAAVSRLAAFPLSGRRYNARDRALVVRNHLVFYRHAEDDNMVVIVAVLDARRDLGRILGTD